MHHNEAIKYPQYKPYTYYIIRIHNKKLFSKLRICSSPFILKKNELPHHKQQAIQ